ncbi:MAG: substrate-binding domain-containing protein [Flaviflexus sp.]|nr:substrate-binding domain-containing protein [Flaviflexus sp.]
MFGQRTKAIGAFALSSCLFVSACGAGDPANNGDSDSDLAPITVGVTVYDMSSFLTAGKDGMEEYAKERNIELLWNSASMDVSTQASQVEQFIDQGVDGIVIVPVQQDSLAPQIERAKAAGIPIIDCNAALDSDELSGSVQPDDVKAGRDQAEMLFEAMGGEGNIVILRGPLGGSGEINRGKGNQEALDAYPNIKVLADETANWNRDEAVNRMSNWISAFGDDIDGVLSQNDDMALGAIQALHEKGMTDVKVVGIDGIEDGLRAVEDGEMVGTFLQHGTVQLAAGLAYVAQLARDDSTEKAELIYEMPEINPDNVGQAMEHVVTGHKDFVKTIPDLVDDNLKSGNIAYEGLPGQEK